MINDDRWYKEVLGALTYCGIGHAPPDKWMTTPDMGFIIARRYNHVVVLLSIEKGRSETFFPLCGEPPHTERLMCMTHVNDNHFMIIYLRIIVIFLPLVRYGDNIVVMMLKAGLIDISVGWLTTMNYVGRRVLKS
jgi:hypothetical protein